jgi:hypothetical protein
MARSDAAEPFIIFWSLIGPEMGAALIEINKWMWRYGRTFPRQISVDQAVEFRKKRVQESRVRGAETVRRRAAAGVMQRGQRKLPLRSE